MWIVENRVSELITAHRMEPRDARSQAEYEMFGRPQQPHPRRRLAESPPPPRTREEYPELPRQTPPSFLLGPNLATLSTQDFDCIWQH